MVLTKAQRRANRLKGQKHERDIRAMLERQGWIVTKWQNNVDIPTRTIIPAKSNSFRMRSTGFPDFLCFRRLIDCADEYEIKFVECKFAGVKSLKKDEKEKIKILDNDFGFITEVL